MDILQYSFFQNAILASLFVSIICGIVGTYVVSRRIVFISGGITHASFGGLGIGFYLGINPLLSALVFAVLSAFGVEYICQSESYKRIREDSMIAVIWSLGMAIGVIFIYLTPGYYSNLSSFLFGNILTITKTDIYWMALLTFFVLLVFIVASKNIIYVAFDRDFAMTQGLPVRFIEYMMMFFVATTIVLSINLIGIMLLICLLTVPQMTANLFTSDYKKITLLSSILSLAGCLSGLFLSYFFNIPSGAFIIIILILFFIVSKAINSKYISIESKNSFKQNNK
jgi:zinc transport system permease protein